MMFARLAPRMPDIGQASPGCRARPLQGARRRRPTFAPGQIDPVGIDAVGQAVAADHVDLDPLAFAAQADDAVAGDRVAAFGELEGDARRQSLDRDGGALRRRLARRPLPAEPGISASITCTSSTRFSAIASISSSSSGS